MSHPHIRTFHARHGRLSDRRKNLLVNVVPRFELPTTSELLDLRQILNRNRVVIDLGCGMGDHTIALAQSQTDTGILAMDVHTSGICDIASQIETHHWTHVALYLGDAIPVLKERLTTQSINEVHILFPDPWPKAKHHKRRIVQPELLRIVRRILIPHGLIHVVTDDDDYADHVRGVFNHQPEWQLVETGFEVPDTSYHRRAIRLGHQIHSITGQLR